MKKKITSICLIAILIISCIIFGGCADVSYQTIKNSEGQIIETVSATLDVEALQKADENVTFKKNQLQILAHSTLIEKFDEFGTRVQTLRNEARDNNNLEMETYYLSILNQVKFFEPQWNEDTLICAIQFDSEDAYLEFYNLDQLNFSTITKKEKWLYKKIYFKGVSGYAFNNGLYSTLSDKLSEMFLTFEKKDTTLKYSYLAKSRRYHSNASTIEFTEEGYLHTWYISSENPNQEIYFYVNVANRSHLYLLAIIISLIVCAILCIVAIFIIMKNRNRKKSLIIRIINNKNNQAEN